MTGGGPVLLVLRALGLGDLLTGVPALRGLRRAFPRHRLVLGAPLRTGAVALAEGLADGVLAVRPWDVPEAAATLGPVDVAVDLHGRGPQSHRLLQALRPRRLVAYANEAAGVSGPAWREGEPEVARWCRLLHEHGWPADPADLRLRPDPPRRAAFALVHPGAASAARRWPTERFAAVVEALADRGLDVAVSAGPGEERLACDVAGRRGRVLRADVRQLADVLAGACLLVVGDTGVGHLSTACGTPSVRLFGPVDPTLWGPTIDPDRHRVLWHGRGGDPHGDAVDPGLAAITVDEVLAAADDVLARTADRAPA